VGTPTQRPRKLSKRGRARCGTHRTGLILAVLRRRGGLWGGDRLSLLGAKEEGLCLRHLTAPYLLMCPLLNYLSTERSLFLHMILNFSGMNFLTMFSLDFGWLRYNARLPVTFRTYPPCPLEQYQSELFARSEIPSVSAIRALYRALVVHRYFFTLGSYADPLGHLRI